MMCSPQYALGGFHGPVYTITKSIAYMMMASITNYIWGVVQCRP